jgi:hypothetical protein
VKPVIFVSYPRSGHHWLIQLATEYCSLLYGAEPSVIPGPRVKPGVFVRAGDFSYCEYYHHCVQVPCTLGALVQKNHDFDLTLPREERFRYVALARDPARSIVSYHEFTGRAKPWPSFARRKAKYWRGFVEKWMLDEHEETLPLMYEQLLYEPAVTLSTFLQFCGIPVDGNVLGRVTITRAPVQDLDPTLDYSQVKEITSPAYRLLLR